MRDKHVVAAFVLFMGPLCMFLLSKDACFYLERLKDSAIYLSSIWFVGLIGVLAMLIFDDAFASEIYAPFKGACVGMFMCGHIVGAVLTALSSDDDSNAEGSAKC